jgi:hypothetical protein
MTHLDLPYTAFDLWLLRLSIGRARRLQLVLDRLRDSVRWHRWIKARPLSRPSVRSLPPERPLPHWSTTAEGLCPCKLDCIVCSAERAERIHALDRPAFVPTSAPYTLALSEMA